MLACLNNKKSGLFRRDPAKSEREGEKVPILLSLILTRRERDLDKEAEGKYSEVRRRRLVDNELRCYECRKVSETEEVEIVEHDGKRFCVCPHCDMETSIVGRVFPPEGASDDKKGLRKA